MGPKQLKGKSPASIGTFRIKEEHNTKAFPVPADFKFYVFSRMK